MITELKKFNTSINQKAMKLDDIKFLLENLITKLSKSGAPDFSPFHLVSNESAKTLMVLYRILFDIEVFKNPKNKMQFFENLSEIIRGPNGEKYKAKTLKNRFSPDMSNCLKDIKRILQDAQDKLDEYENKFHAKGFKK